MFLPLRCLENVLSLLLLFLQSHNNVECSPQAPFPFHSPGTILTQDSFKDWIKTKSSWNRFLFKMSDPVHGCLVLLFLSSTDNWNVCQWINLRAISCLCSGLYSVKLQCKKKNTTVIDIFWRRRGGWEKNVYTTQTSPYVKSFETVL